jgi:hypothetical protein
MKALVLSDGAGTRSRTVTHTPAGQPVPRADKAVLADGLDSVSDAGITPGGGIVGDSSGRGPREQPEHPTTDLAPAGVHPCTPVIHAAVRAVEPPRRGELEITHRPPAPGPPSRPRGPRRGADPVTGLLAAAHVRADEPGTAPRTRRATLRLSALCKPFPSGSCSSARSPVMGSSQQVCSTEPVSARAAGSDRGGERSGTSAGPDRDGPTSSGACNGPAPRPAYRAPGRDRWTEVAPASHQDRRSALHEALPHIRKEISQ